MLEDDEEIDPNIAHRIEVSSTFDLHAFAPRDMRAALEEFLFEAQRHGMRELRVIHGRGIGVQREMVRGVLAKTPFVASFGDAPPESGGWGATVITLCQPGNRTDML